MDREKVIDYCQLKPSAMETFPFDNITLVVKVGGKMFALIPTNGSSESITLKCEPFLAQLFRDKYASVSPAYHMNKKHWNTVFLKGDVPVRNC